MEVNVIVIVDIKRRYCDANGFFKLGESQTNFGVPCDGCARMAERGLEIDA